MTDRSGDLGPLMTRAEVAAHLGISEAHVRRVMADHHIPYETGYRRDHVLALQYVKRAGQGRRTDLHPPTEQENPR